MHEIARHTTHCSEMLSIAIAVLQHMIDEQEQHHPPGQIVDFASHEHKRIARAFDESKSLLQSFRLRSLALESRIRNEINLAFHVNSLQDSRIATQLARSAKFDNQTMKTISILGLILLPGTFISVKRPTLTRAMRAH